MENKKKIEWDGYQKPDDGELGRKEIRKRIRRGDRLLLFKNDTTKYRNQIETHVFYLNPEHDNVPVIDDDWGCIMDDNYSGSSMNDVFKQYVRWSRKHSSRYRYLMYWEERVK